MKVSDCVNTFHWFNSKCVTFYVILRKLCCCTQNNGINLAFLRPKWYLFMVLRMLIRFKVFIYIVEGIRDFHLLNVKDLV